MSNTGESPKTADIKKVVVKRQPDPDVAALFSSLRLQHSHYQPFTRRPSDKAPDENLDVEEAARADPTLRTRIHIGIFSPVGGSGKTTMTASLGSVLCKLGKRVLLVDAAPWQSLAFHFGASEVRPGKRTFFAPGARDTAVHLLSCDQKNGSFPLLDEFATITAVDYVLFDLSGLSGDRLLEYLRQCDHVFVPLLPDSSSVRFSTIAQSLLDSVGPAAPRLRFVLNNMDPSMAAQEVHTLLTHSLGDQLFPSVILNQLEVRKALEDGVVLPFHSPEAQATVVFNEIIRGLLVPERPSIHTERRWSEE